MIPDICIANRRIGKAQPPLIVAELSGNHKGELDRARRLIEACAKAGVEAVKLQTYEAGTLTIDHDGPGFRLKSGLWEGRTLFELYKEAETPFAWHKVLFQQARDCGLIVFSTPFDETAIDLLESLDVPAFKIASFEIIDLPLIQRAARSGKPLILSTGMSTPLEITQAIEAAKQGGGRILYCCIVSAAIRRNFLMPISDFCQDWSRILVV